jgi:hypothetical protein
MSSTGFFHSRLCGTLADAGCWAFILGVIVIHPPKKTQPHAKFDLVAAHGAVAVGTYDAGVSLRSLPGKALCSSLLLDQGVTSRGLVHSKRRARLHHCRGNTRNRQFGIL